MKINSWKYKLQLYFTFTRRERNGILVLVAFILILQLTLLCLNFLSAARPITIDDDTKIKILEIQKQWQEEEANENLKYTNKFVATPSKVKFDSLFEFDPNKLTTEEWQLLGLSFKQSVAINKWIYKCGGVKTIEDFKKIKVLYPDQQERLLQYLRIENLNVEKKNTDRPQYASAQKNPFASTYQSRKKLNIEINAADSISLMDLPMIGEGRARAIIRYRNALGGYYSILQLHELRQLPDTVFNIIEPMVIVNAELVRKINLNMIETGFYHPYFTKSIVNAIVNYRKQHGNYSSIDEIMRIPLLDDKLYRKIAPYLLVN